MAQKNQASYRERTLGQSGQNQYVGFPVTVVTGQSGADFALFRRHAVVFRTDSSGVDSRLIPADSIARFILA